MLEIPTTSARVPEHGPREANRDIEEGTLERLAEYSGHPRAIDERLEEIEREWDIERTLELNAAILSLGGAALAATVSGRWLILPAVVAGFLAQHAVQGWCPPVEVFRRFGFRTQREIDEERMALKLLRGDFDDLWDADGTREDPRAVLAAVQA